MNSSVLPQLLILAGALGVACGSSQRNKKNYADAPKAVAFGVVATGVYRGVTGGCWAQCTHGLVCDEESGTCIPYEQKARKQSLRARTLRRPAPGPSLTRSCGCADASLAQRPLVADGGADAAACVCPPPAQSEEAGTSQE